MAKIVTIKRLTGCLDVFQIMQDEDVDWSEVNNALVEKWLKEKCIKPECTETDTGLILLLDLDCAVTLIDAGRKLPLQIRNFAPGANNDGRYYEYDDIKFYITQGEASANVKTCFGIEFEDTAKKREIVKRLVGTTIKSETLVDERITTFARDADFCYIDQIVKDRKVSYSEAVNALIDLTCYNVVHDAGFMFARLMKSFAPELVEGSFYYRYEDIEFRIMATFDDTWDANAEAEICFEIGD